VLTRPYDGLARATERVWGTEGTLLSPARFRTLERPWRPFLCAVDPAFALRCAYRLVRLNPEREVQVVAASALPPFEAARYAEQLTSRVFPVQSIAFRLKMSGTGYREEYKCRDDVKAFLRFLTRCWTPNTKARK
jgi:hypothetical protein